MLQNRMVNTREIMLKLNHSEMKTGIRQEKTRPGESESQTKCLSETPHSNRHSLQSSEQLYIFNMNVSKRKYYVEK